MLTIVVPEREVYDENANMFFYTKEQILVMEHSLVSISKWESKWHKPFFGMEPKTNEETIDYLRCMTLTQNVDAQVYYCLSEDNYTEIEKYIDDPMTATWFSDNMNAPKKKEVITSELIYYWMIGFNIPMECQKWHINRLLTLIHICNIKNAPPKKMSKSDIYSRNRALNEARRKMLNSKG